MPFQNRMMTLTGILAASINHAGFPDAEILPPHRAYAGKGQNPDGVF
jgi:hypothetical protein